MRDATPPAAAMTVRAAVPAETGARGETTSASVAGMSSRWAANSSSTKKGLPPESGGSVHRPRGHRPAGDRLELLGDVVAPSGSSSSRVTTGGAELGDEPAQRVAGSSSPAR